LQHSAALTTTLPRVLLNMSVSLNYVIQ
jgi:hypothetical protein